MSESARFTLAMVAFVLMTTLLAIGMSPPSATWIPVNGFPLSARLAADAQPPIEPQPPPQAEDKGPQASKSDLWSGAAATLLGAVIGFAAAWLPKYWDDRQKRRLLATLLLSEIRFVDRFLRGVIGVRIDYNIQIDPSSFLPSLRAMYSQAGANLLLFSPETVHAVGLFYSVLSRLLERARTEQVDVMESAADHVRALFTSMGNEADRVGPM
jgi:hypothetical protein